MPFALPFQSLFFWNNLNNLPGVALPRSRSESFNPYSSGTISTTKPRSMSHRCCKVFQSLFFWNNLNNGVRLRHVWRSVRVSILILLEQSQQLGPNVVIGDHVHIVSILILLEQSQQHHPDCVLIEDAAVSILILLEQSQQLVLRADEGRPALKFQSLFFWNNLNNTGCVVPLPVAIQFQSLFFWNNLNNTAEQRRATTEYTGFNPYSSGTISTTISCVRHTVSGCPVSILILLEQSQQHCLLLPRRGAYRGFNPYSSGTISTTPSASGPRNTADWGFNPYSSGTISTTTLSVTDFLRTARFQSLFFWNNLNNRKT